MIAQAYYRPAIATDFFSLFVRALDVLIDVCIFQQLCKLYQRNQSFIAYPSFIPRPLNLSLIKV